MRSHQYTIIGASVENVSHLIRHVTGSLIIVLYIQEHQLKPTDSGLVSLLLNIVNKIHFGTLFSSSVTFVQRGGETVGWSRILRFFWIATQKT